MAKWKDKSSGINIFTIDVFCFFAVVNKGFLDSNADRLLFETVKGVVNES